jgi:hypothetical protein
MVPTAQDLPRKDQGWREIAAEIGSAISPCVEPGRPSPNPLLLQSRLQPTVIRICTGCRDWNRCPCRKIGGVNPVCLERCLAHQWVLGVPQGSGIIRMGVTVVGCAARGHDEKKGRCNEQSHLINP